ncbi:hypothetical protein Q9Q99_18640 [Curtobacterium flaccumfaciens]|nr:hypothetical protein Q9Q99_18640 [Curtobacterium flaccumfaciens]
MRCTAHRPSGTARSQRGRPNTSSSRTPRPGTLRHPLDDHADHADRTDHDEAA